MTFRELGLSAPILKALEKQGYETPSPIQQEAIPPAIAGRDVLGCAQTGTGKTCAFATPILHRLAEKPVKGHPIRTLILTPTRELAIQIGESFDAYGENLNLRCAVIFGGVAQGPQVSKLRNGVDILVATPGRLGDLYNQKLIDLSKLEIFVLDEADRMLDMGFIHDVKRILTWLPKEKQTLFFSATMPPEITSLVNSLLHNPVKVAVTPVSSPVEAITQSLYFVDKNNKPKLLAHLVRKEKIKNALVFSRTKHGANKISQALQKEGITSAAIHGNKSQTARQQALADFKSGKLQCLVATDIAARGIDIDELSHVFNFNLPEVPETFVHRIGRTGRAGREGEAIAFCDFSEKGLLKDIEKLMGRNIPVVENHPFPMQVFELPKKDKQGRVINQEDAEARQAAKERRRLRDGENKAAADARREKNNKAIAGAKPVEKEYAPVKDTTNRRKNKNQQAEVKQDTAQQKDKARRNRGVRAGSVVDTGTDMPNTDFHRPSIFEGDQIMDATARLLAPRKVSKPATQPQRTAKADKPAKPVNTGRSQTKDKRNPMDALSEKRSKPAQKKKTYNNSGNQSAGNRQENGGQKSGAGKPRNGGNRRGPMPPMERPRKQKDSTEQNTLMKPFYLDFK